MARSRAAALAGLLALAGCSGKGEQMIPVEGRVVHGGGGPLTVGTVIFHPDPGKGNASLHEPRGAIGPDGRYALEVGSRAKGAPPGWYRVTVYAGVPSNPKDEYSPEKLIVDKKYTDVKTSGLEFEVRDGAPPGSYDIKLAE